MNPALEAWINRWWRPLLALGVGLHFTTLFGTLTEPDSALYAIVAKNMARSGDLINLIAYGGDWLDKPHFLFWVASTSMRLFGVNEIAWRLPALGFFFLALHYTWRLGVLLFDRTAARLAVLLLLVAEHTLLSNADVRAEPYLVGLVVAAVFHLLSARGVGARATRTLAAHLIAGAAFTAAAMSTKGPFLLVPICGALIAHDWRALLKWRTLVGAVLIALFLLPELAALYLQYDLHPEKVMFGRTGVSGVRFFFWDSQFGRFLNTGPLKGYGDPTYFFHVVLWAFLPWSLWLYFAAAARVRQALEKQPSPWGGRELHVWGGALLTMLVFTASRSQLPHYLNIVFPFFALAIASWLTRLESPRAKAWATRLGLAVTVGMPLAAIGLLLVVEPPAYLAVAAGVGAVALASFALFRGLTLEATIGRAFLVAVAVNLALIRSYLPFLLSHQVGKQAAEMANTLPPMQTALVEVESLTFDFQLAQPVVRWTADDTRKMTETGPARVLTSASGKTWLEERGLEVKVLATWDSFHVSLPTRTFLDARTRSTVVEPWVLAEVSR
ncbi:MAG: glycosyltransferase family 39 protein [Archangium sp.]|nr:glycosyltransferase family 39 protein [Archangium sp.]